MNWDAISAVSEFLGTIAVVATMGYLAVQIRYARLAAADASRHARADGVRETLLAIALNEDISRLTFQAYSSEAKAIYEQVGTNLDMSGLEYFRLDSANLAWVWTHWGQWAAIKTPEDLAELRHIVGEFYSVPPTSITWDKSPIGKNLLDENFVRFVDEVLEEKRQSQKKSLVD